MTQKKSNKLLEDGQVKRARLPTRNELFAVVREMQGGSRMKALCEDGLTRMIRIGGRFKRRMWVRPNDLILIKPWPIQEKEKADLVYRYLPAERNWIIKRKIIPKEMIIW